MVDHGVEEGEVPVQKGLSDVGFGFGGEAWREEGDEVGEGEEREEEDFVCARVDVSTNAGVEGAREDRPSFCGLWESIASANGDRPSGRGMN